MRATIASGSTNSPRRLFSASPAVAASQIAARSGVNALQSVSIITEAFQLGGCADSGPFVERPGRDDVDPHSDTESLSDAVLDRRLQCRKFVNGPIADDGNDHVVAILCAYGADEVVGRDAVDRRGDLSDRLRPDIDAAQLHHVVASTG